MVDRVGDDGWVNLLSQVIGKAQQSNIAAK